MNQTQIVYFEKKIEAALRGVKSSIKDSAETLPALSYGEKAAQIESGKARFRIEKFSGPDCPYRADHLFEFFEFNGEDEITSKNAKNYRRRRKKDR